MFSVEKHKIFLDLSTRLPPIALKIHKAEKSKTELYLSKEEGFFLDLFHRLNEIDNKLRDLEMAKSFIATFPAYKSWRKKMSRSEYITYHLEYYYINLVALFDRLIHLVNFLFDLGLADQFVNLKSIVTNKHVTKDVSKLLSKIDNSLKDKRTLQNKIKHKEKLLVKELYHPSLLEFSLRDEDLKKKFSKKDQFGLKQDMNYLYREFIQIKKKEMNVLNLKVNDQVQNFLDLLFDKYVQRRSQVIGIPTTE